MIKTILYKQEKNLLLVKTYSTENKQIRQADTGSDYPEGIAFDIGIEVNGEYFPKYHNYIELEQDVE